MNQIITEKEMINYDRPQQNLDSENINHFQLEKKKLRDL